MQHRPEKSPVRILEVSASGRRDGSVSRQLSADLIDALETRYGSIELTQRDLGNGVPFVDAAWIDANFTAPEVRNSAQQRALAESDGLVAELQSADILVVATPVYNFSVPATLKAWIDMVARARLTFRYTENGPEGLLQGKKAFVVIASGGVLVDSPADYATPYLRQALNFLGITDIEVFGADRLNSRAEDAVDAARARIAELVHTTRIPGIREQRVA